MRTYQESKVSDKVLRAEFADDMRFLGFMVIGFFVVVGACGGLALAVFG